MRLFALVAMLSASIASAAAPSIEISGALPKTESVTLEQLAKLGPEKAQWSSHGQAHTITGISLWKLLAHFGIEEGPQGEKVPPSQKHAGLRKAVIASADDGFAAVFSLGELAPEVGASRVLVVWELDGKPLPQNRGPFRIVALGDQSPARSLFHLSRLQVVALSPEAK